MCGGCLHKFGVRVTHRPVSLNTQLLPQRGVGYDVMVHVGRARYMDHRQREDIRRDLERAHGLRFSSGQVSWLSRLFVNYLARLHHACSEDLKVALTSEGVWPMHVDTAGENGRGTLFVVMADWRQWVLGAWKISTWNLSMTLRHPPAEFSVV
ncbi:hypothetical protein LR032_00320, partial [Candidatus Bipolaricaulota bacterium]|nr:hypothetical protein [Candidatus Bipolaricaulota bacterium]